MINLKEISFLIREIRDKSWRAVKLMITYEGLTNHLPAIVIAKENPDLETKKEYHQ